MATKADKILDRNFHISLKLNDLPISVVVGVKPGRPRQEPPRRWHGRRGTRRGPVAYADGRLDEADLRFLVVHSTPWAHQGAGTCAAAQAKEAERVTAPGQHVEARWFACSADAEAAIAAYAGRGQGRRGRTPRPWRSHVVHSQGEAGSVPTKRPQRGRPPKPEEPEVEVRYRLRVAAEAVIPVEDAHGGTVLATTLQPEACTDTEVLQAYQAQPSTVEPGLRWRKHPTASSPVWLENPERIAALAMRTALGLLGYAVIPRQVRLSLSASDRYSPGNTGPTTTPTTAGVCALLTPVTLVHFTVDNAPWLQV